MASKRRWTFHRLEIVIVRIVVLLSLLFAVARLLISEIMTFHLPLH
jgi:hypothetical protein